MALTAGTVRASRRVPIDGRTMGFELGLKDLFDRPSLCIRGLLVVPCEALHQNKRGVVCSRRLAKSSFHGESRIATYFAPSQLRELAESQPTAANPAIDPRHVGQ